MTTKAAFITALGAKLQAGTPKEFARTSGNICTATAHGYKTGAGPFKVMTTSAGDVPSGLVAAVRATTFATAATVIATDTATIAGKAYTFIATPASDGDVDVGASDAGSMENLARAVNLGVGAGTKYDIDTVGNPTVSAESVGDTILITAKTLDATVGNAITVASTGGTLTWDNATLEGGVDGTDYYLIRLTDDTFSLATSKANAIAGTAVTLADAGTGVHTLVATTETLAEALEDVLVNLLVHTGTRVYPAADNTAAFWAAAIAGIKAA